MFLFHKIPYSTEKTTVTLDYLKTILWNFSRFELILNDIFMEIRIEFSFKISLKCRF